MASSLRDILLGHREELEELIKKPYIPRENLENARRGIGQGLIHVVTGPRRAGKSVFCLQLLKDIPIAYVNFDDERLLKLTDYDELIAAIREVYGPLRTFFFDEIQNLARWELFVNRLQRKGYQLVITGSNSKLLSQELATHLTGRHLAFQVLPFSFREYLQTKQVDLTKVLLPKEAAGDCKRHLENYLYIGGYPEVVVKGIDPKQYLTTLFESILFKDIVKRYNIRYPQKLYDLATYLLTHCGSEFSYTALKKFLVFRSVHTVENYVSFLEEAFLILQVQRFSFAPKERVKSPKKCYGIDTGLIEAIKFKISKDIGRYMENAVALELCRRYVEFYSYKMSTGREIDFVLKQGEKITTLMQVCYDVSDPMTKEREVRALVQAAKEFHLRKGIIVTWDYGAQEEMSEVTLIFIPLWKWLLEKEA